MRVHPDRLAATLAQREQLALDDVDAAQQPDPGSADARVDLKLLAFRAQEAIRDRGTPAASARLSDLTSPHLWAGTVQDGTARGFMVALEEAISLCKAAPIPDGGPHSDTETEDLLTGGAVFEGKQLRRKKDILVASGGARIRFSRKGGLLFVDRDSNTHIENCLCFEDRTDDGTLDGFEPKDGERPRIFLPGFLNPAYLRQGKERDVLVLEGRLGRGAVGFPCRIQIEGRKDEPRIHMRVGIENRARDHRLRIRFRGLPESIQIESRGTPGWERVEHRGHWFTAATLVRACGQLAVGSEMVAVAAAQCLGWIEHDFYLGASS